MKSTKPTQVSNIAYVIIALILYVQSGLSMLMSQHVFLTTSVIACIFCMITFLIMICDDNLMDVFDDKKNYDMAGNIQLVMILEPLLLFVTIISLILSFFIIDQNNEIIVKFDHDRVIMFQTLLINVTSLLSCIFAYLISKLNADLISYDIDDKNKKVINKCLLPSGTKCCPYNKGKKNNDEMMTLVNIIYVDLVPGMKFTINGSTYFIGKLSDCSSDVMNVILMPTYANFRSNLLTEIFSITLKNGHRCILDQNTAITLFSGTLVNDGVTEIMLVNDTNVLI